MPKSINKYRYFSERVKMSQIDREELSKMLDQFKKGKKSNFGLR